MGVSCFLALVIQTSESAGEAERQSISAIILFGFMVFAGCRMQFARRPVPGLLQCGSTELAKHAKQVRQCRKAHNKSVLFGQNQIKANRSPDLATHASQGGQSQPASGGTEASC